MVRSIVVLFVAFFPISSQATDEDKWECSSESESSQDTLFAQMGFLSIAVLLKSIFYKNDLEKSFRSKIPQFLPYFFVNK